MPPRKLPPGISYDQGRAAYRVGVTLDDGTRIQRRVAGEGDLGGVGRRPAPRLVQRHCQIDQRPRVLMRLGLVVMW